VIEFLERLLELSLPFAKEEHRGVKRVCKEPKTISPSLPAHLTYPYYSPKTEGAAAFPI